jgi:excisionase family DNA binding protein
MSQAAPELVVAVNRVHVPAEDVSGGCGYLRISLATIDRMVRANELPSVLIRGRRLFRIRHLDDYIRSHSIPGCSTRSKQRHLIDGVIPLTHFSRNNSCLSSDRGTDLKCGAR